MEERAEYLKTPPRRGKVFVGGYLEPQDAERLRKAAELRNCNMTELLAYVAQQMTAVLPTTRTGTCGCSHE